MLLVAFDADFYLHWGHQTWQQGKICSGMFAAIEKPRCLRESAHKSKHYLSEYQSKMHLMTFDPEYDLIRGRPTGQPDEIRSGMFADVDKPSCALFRKSAHKS